MKNTLDFVDIKPGRKVGNTTRQINKAVELLFNGEIVEIKDHMENGNHIPSNYRLYELIRERLFHEHRINDKHLLINNKVKYFEISLKNEN